MLDAINEPGVWTVVIMSAAQMGKTELLLNIIAYFIDQDPSPILCIQPNIKPMGESFSKDRVATMIRDTAALRGKVKDSKGRDGGNTILHKEFPGGTLDIAGANSPASLASRPKRIALFDETDRYPVSAGAEGDPIALGTRRTSTFHNRFIVLTSTPTVKGASRIEFVYEQSDKRRFYLPCPHCGLYQPLHWSGIKWAKDDDGAWDKSPPWYECEGCAAALTESDKAKMVRYGRWVAEGQSDGIAGFHISELYSPWRTWSEVVTDFLASKDDTELLRAFVNTSLGETFEETGEGLEPAGLLARCEVYPAPVPAAGLVICCGVDVQDDRLEALVTAYGRGDRQYKLARRVIRGDPAGAAVWADLDALLFTEKWRHESGALLGIAATCIDTGGHHTKSVYEYCKRNAGKRVFAIKGMAGFGRPMVSAPSKKRHGRDRRPVELYLLGVDEIKARVYARLKNEKVGPGYVHFPVSDEFDESFFDQLTAETCVTTFSHGIPKRVWKLPRGKRNEGLDCDVYGYGALQLLNPNYDALEKRMVAPRDKGGDEPTGGSKKTKGTRRSKRGGYVNWKG